MTISISLSPVVIMLMVLASGLNICWSEISASNCPCQSESLCLPVNVDARTEVVAFSLYRSMWKHYNWTHLTTIILDEIQLTDVDPELLCYAHARNVRLLALVAFPKEALENQTLQQSWIVDTIQMVADKHLDGINIDTERYYQVGTAKANDHVNFINRTVTAFHSVFPGSLITYDASYQDSCTPKSCTDSITIASIVDFIISMNYDENGNAYAYSNSPYYNTIKGVKSYLKDGIDPQKLVVVEPWYGYDYKCANRPLSDLCIIQKDSSRSLNANTTKAKPKISKFPFVVPDDDDSKSDPNQASITFAGVCKLLRNHTRKWNNVTKTPYLTYKRYTGDYHQVCYDDAESLKLKSEYIFSMNLRGIGAWTVDFADYINFPKESTGIWEGLTFGLDKKLALERRMNY